MRRKGCLVLEDGTEYHGVVVGAERAVSGEVVFSTAMTGYAESLSDPSFHGQILMTTYPLVGNYGLPEMRQCAETGLHPGYEGGTLHPLAFVMHDYTEEYSHWDASMSLEEGLARAGITGLTGIDTRALTQKLRDSGPLLGKVLVEGQEEIPFTSTDEVNQIAEVSCREVIRYGTGKYHVVLVDCGVKEGIIRALLERDLSVIRVPWDYNVSDLACDGVLVSNGPGSPRHCEPTVQQIRAVLRKGIPYCGICMGNQLTALAIGAEVYKMKYGHRSVNQPVRMVGTNRCYITSQNHGFAVDNSTLPKDWSPYFVNLNDGTNEGLRHESGRAFTVQFHPEASPGPTDTSFFFDDFKELIESTTK